jgi:hypothetical protein
MIFPLWGGSSRVLGSEGRTRKSFVSPRSSPSILFASERIGAEFLEPEKQVSGLELPEQADEYEEKD